jgi:nucleoside phosphorylase
MNQNSFGKGITSIESTYAKQIYNNINILILVATEIELTTVLQELKPIPSEKDILTCMIDTNFYYFGTFGIFPVAVLKCDMGSTGRNASSIKVYNAISLLNLKAIIMMGIAFGVDSKKQKVGDILISKELYSYENAKVEQGKINFRGETYNSGNTLWNVFSNYASELNRNSTELKAITGDILSGEKVIDDETFRDILVNIKSTVIGGEMEGAGLFAVSCNRNVECILIKSICDFADGYKSQNKEQFQSFAATTSVLFCKYVLSHKGILDDLNIEDIFQIYNDNDIFLCKFIISSLLLTTAEYEFLFVISL